MKRALITGISGQDGSYLAELLLEKGYEVHGLVHGGTDRRFDRLEPVIDRLNLYPGDLLDESSLVDVLRQAKPDEVYNLAAMSSVAQSWRLAVATAEYTAVGVTRLLEGIREVCPEARFYQASSSEMFGRAQRDTAEREHPLLPAQPLRRRQGLRPLHHRELPGELRALHELRDPLQPRVAAAGRVLRHPPDQPGRRSDQARPRRRARPRQPRGPPRLGLRQGIRRGDVADAPAGAAD